MDTKRIRNFSIIAHIDHGKSTLADRMLEVTKTIESRKMRDQVLDNMELERERGITIKMQPVRMEHVFEGENYELNLIDTPGHIDFSYEVSRALKAVEGSILLVDATQGVQAQTLTTLSMARESGLVIIPVLSKIDSPLARVSEVKKEVALLLECDEEEILLVSGKTGEGVSLLLDAVINRIPAPLEKYIDSGGFRALIFDFKYSNHKGVIVFVRVLDGEVSKNTNLLFKSADEKFIALEVGTFSPDEKPKDVLGPGSIGYIVTGIKKPGIASVGDTVVDIKHNLPGIPGYFKPWPVVWASIYGESQDDFNELKSALGKLRLSDSAFSFEEESSGLLGRGFRVGFLGMLHLEIITERLRREFDLELVVTSPSITYEVTLKNGKKEIIYSPHLFPSDGLIEEVMEPWVEVKIITPLDYLGALMQLCFEHEAEIGETVNFGDNRSQISMMMPLRELMRNFFDELKGITSGYASISYEIGELRHAEVTRIDILVAEEIVPAFTRVVSKRQAAKEAEDAVEKLHAILPRQQFTTKIQGYALGRILSSRTLSAFRKDVLMHGSKVVGGGDISRKKKLLEKQKKGKARMKESGKVTIPHDVFIKMMKKGEN